MKCIVYGFWKIGQLMVKQFLDKGWDIPIIIDNKCRENFSRDRNYWS